MLQLKKESTSHYFGVRQQRGKREMQARLTKQDCKQNKAKFHIYQGEWRGSCAGNPRNIARTYHDIFLSHKQKHKDHPNVKRSQCAKTEAD